MIEITQSYRKNLWDISCNIINLLGLSVTLIAVAILMAAVLSDWLGASAAPNNHLSP